jgi:large subunit ribosomal protein L5
MAKKSAEKSSKGAAPSAGGSVPPGYRPRLQKLYREHVVAKLQKEFGIENRMAVPRLEKIVLNMGVGEGSRNIKVLESAVEELAALAGQRPTITRAKKSIAAFKLREGMPIGCRVTLRRYRMWEFLDRLISIALPRVRDFRGLPTGSFDGRASYTIGVREHVIFPEVDYSKVDVIKGMNITLVTSGANDEQARLLLEELGLPFTRPGS